MTQNASKIEPGVAPETAGPDPLNRSLWSRVRSVHLHFITLLFSAAALFYAFAFVKNLSSVWFNPKITTDDALQQIFQFHEVNNPGIFKGDLIYDTMNGYLTPIHYWLSYAVTALTGDPIMMGHWLMLFQLVYAGVFIFLAVNQIAGAAPACFSVAWLLHTRNIVQRMTAGLVRGWSAGVLASFLYFALKGNHRAVLITLLIGCLLSPPAVAIALTSYGVFLCWKVLWPSSRAQYKWPLLTFLLCCPVYLATLLVVIHRPPEVGQMVSLEVASQMPEFQNPGGRFAFLPFPDALEQIKTFGTQTFVARWYNPGHFLRANMLWIMLGIFLFSAYVGWRKGRVAIPAQLTFFILSIFTIYFLSREFAFKLYVPDRHLQFPIAIFVMIAMPAALWRAFYQEPGLRVVGTDLARLKPTFSRTWLSAFSLCALAGLIYLGSQTGLQGMANFNYSIDKHGKIFSWIRKYTPERSLVAGNPTHIDGVLLFGMRRAYATTETAHPFYLGYYREIERRLKISLRANYATDAHEFVKLLEPEGIDYFVFKRKDFYPDELKTAGYYRPLDILVHELASRPANEYLYKQLPVHPDLELYPFMPFKDNSSALIDVKAFRKFLDGGGVLPAHRNEK